MINKIWDLLHKHNKIHEKLDDLALTHTSAFAIVVLLFGFLPYNIAVVIYLFVVLSRMYYNNFGNDRDTD